MYRDVRSLMLFKNKLNIFAPKLLFNKILDEKYS